MRIAVPTESCPQERRVALTPQSVTQLIKIGHEVAVEQGAGTDAGFSDDSYAEAGAQIVADRAQLIADAELVVQVRGYGADATHAKADLGLFKDGQICIGLQDPLWAPELTQELAQTGATVMALETIPRISRAQSMDVLSSMATNAGYKAVLIAAVELPQMFPMMMTAAGTVTAAKVLVMGAGVAGLQAIATARRLGAVVQGYDIRPAASEQIRSLGAKAVELQLDSAESEDAGGYAKAQGDDFNRRQQELLAQVVADSDVVITTAAIPGAKSPILVTTSMVEGMSPGSVIVDLAAERGGNCELTVADQRVDHGGVIILGPTDLPSQVARDGSSMFSNNITSLIKHLTEDGEITLDLDDEITRDTLVARSGEVLHPRMREKLNLEPLEPPAQPEEETDDTNGSEGAED